MVRLPPRVAVPPQASRILLVRGMGNEPDAESVYKLFGEFGSIQEVRVATDNKHGELVIVIFFDVLSAFAAQKRLNGFVFNGKNLRIKFHYFSRKRLVSDHKEPEL